jgi:hypothetical protein
MYDFTMSWSGAGAMDDPAFVLLVREQQEQLVKAFIASSMHFPFSIQNFGVFPWGNGGEGMNAGNNPTTATNTSSGDEESGSGSGDASQQAVASTFTTSTSYRIYLPPEIINMPLDLPQLFSDILINISSNEKSLSLSLERLQCRLSSMQVFTPNPTLQSDVGFYRGSRLTVTAFEAQSLAVVSWTLQGVESSSLHHFLYYRRTYDEKIFDSLYQSARELPEDNWLVSNSRRFGDLYAAVFGWKLVKESTRSALSVRTCRNGQACSSGCLCENTPYELKLLTYGMEHGVMIKLESNTAFASITSEITAPEPTATSASLDCLSVSWRQPGWTPDDTRFVLTLYLPVNGCWVLLGVVGCCWVLLGVGC